MRAGVIWGVDRMLGQRAVCPTFMLPLHGRVSSISKDDGGCCPGVAGQEVSARDSPRGEFPTGAHTLVHT